ncbi:DNA methyltransferase [Paenibacillus sp. FSL M7-1046]|uniref:DNA methyltransferase n=1 Tax=Paenibacillus sp. FSL M7-1046 TaxID=2975315 RepID=UPI0030FBCB32
MKGKSPSWYGDRTQTIIWDVSRGDVSKYFHPNQKPLELLAIPIQNSSQRGGTVVDLFGGSGSTLMTCEQLDRSCRTTELDPVFCDVIKLRYQIATDIEPVLLHRDT